MAEKNAKEFLEALNEGAEILAYMEEYQLPEGKDKEDGLVDVAAHFGYVFRRKTCFPRSNALQKRPLPLLTLHPPP
jgi:hypothetical protein